MTNSTLDAMTVVHPNAAGLDIGAHEIWAALRPDLPGETVRRFATFTPDLEALADWLQKCGVDPVAMESTGVYWIPVFDLLEKRGFQVFLINASHIKHVPGRKSDLLPLGFTLQTSVNRRPSVSPCLDDLFPQRDRFSDLPGNIWRAKVGRTSTTGGASYSHHLPSGN